MGKAAPLLDPSRTIYLAGEGQLGDTTNLILGNTVSHITFHTLPDEKEEEEKYVFD